MVASRLLVGLLLAGSTMVASAQGMAEQNSAQSRPSQCWDQANKQLRQRSPSDETVARGKERDPEETSAGESGSSEGMAAIAPGSKGSASKRAAAESNLPEGSARPPGMPDC